MILRRIPDFECLQYFAIESSKFVNNVEFFKYDKRYIAYAQRANWKKIRDEFFPHMELLFEDYRESFVKVRFISK